MKHLHAALALVAASLLSTAARADIVITEVSPYSSGNAAFAADWFELTNTGASAVSISGFRVDDNSNSFASSLGLTGVTSIAPGESVIFLEGGATQITGFLAHWFGSNVPAGLQVGSYSGTGIGLSTGGDSVNIFDASGARVAGVSFGTAAIGQTFDNSGLLNGLTLPLPTVTGLSVVGVNGAFNSVAALSSGVPVGTLDIGSPGVSPVPDAPSAALMLAGLAGLALARRRRV